MALDFFCHCLNIRIHIDEGNISESLENCSDDVVNSDPFFANVFLVLTPSGVEILKKMQCLSHEREKNHWRINTCLNCSMETHAISTNEEFPLRKIFISTTMQQNVSTANLISSSKNFSPIYEVLISQLPQEKSMTCLPLLPRNQLHNHIEELKEHTIFRLNAENEFLLERIRKFENEQIASFNELQIQTRHDQNTLMQMLNNYYSESENVTCNSKPVDGHQDAKIPSVAPVAFQTSKPERDNVTNSQPSPVKSSLAPKSAILTIDDSIFLMDDEEIKVEEHDGSLYDSEPEVLDDQASTAKSDTIKLFATSMPIAMPNAWNSSRHAQKNDVKGNENGKTEDDPTWIAASMQQLARSIRGNDGTEMFGARPRPRLNTLD